jgi:hypothetical protein
MANVYYKERMMKRTTHPLYAVFHANDLMTRTQPDHEWWSAKQNGDHRYQLVAIVEAPLEEVFQLTNHIDHAWWDNPQILWSPVTGQREAANDMIALFPPSLLAEQQPRSTSTGDIIVACQTKRAWLVMPVGFQEIQEGRGGYGDQERKKPQ